MTSRRCFVRDSGIVFGAMMVPGVLKARPGGVAPSDLVRVGVIGCNGMGFSNLRSILKIPEGTQPGTTFKLKGMGITKDGTQGDQFVTVNVQLPTDLSPEERKLFEKLAEKHGSK